MAKETTHGKKKSPLSRSDDHARKRAEEALRQSEEKYRNIVNTATEGIWIGDAEMRTAFVNQKLAEMLGYGAEELIGRLATDFMDADVQDHTRQQQERRKKGLADRYEQKYRRKDGTAVWAITSAAPVFDEKGQFAGSLAMLVDITDRKQAEAKLRETTRRFQTILDHAPIAIYVKNRDGRFVYGNRQLEKYTGQPVERLLGMSDYEFASKEDADRWRENDRRVLEGQRAEFEETGTDRDGRPYINLSVKFPLTDESGTPVEVCAIATDITARKGAEEAVRESEKQFKVLIQNLHSAVAMIDERGAFIIVNQSFRRMFGIGEEEDIPNMNSRDWREWQVFNERSVLIDMDEHPVRRAALTGKAVRNQLIALKAPTSPDFKWLLVSAEPILDAQGGLQRLICTYYDITEQKRTEEALRKAHDELEHRVEERTSDLRTALERLSAERQRFHDVLDMMPAYVVLLTPDHHVPFANRFFEQRFGKSNGKRCYEYLFNRTSPCEVCETYCVLKTNKPHQWEWTGPDGRNYDIHDFPFTDVDGSPLIMEVGVDVTEQKKSQNAIKAEHQRLMDVLETLPAMICLLTPDHKVTFANRGFREKFGEANGRPCYEYCFGRTAPCEFCESFEVLKTGQPHHWEVKVPDGSVISAHDFPFSEADGSTLVLEMDIDITERRRAEIELREAHDALGSRADQLRALAGELTLTEQRERQRLAKILHDHLQQLLVGAKLRTTILGRAGDDVIRQAANEVEKLLDDCIAASRSLTAELSPPILHDAGLNEGLRWLARWMTDKHGLFVDLSLESETPPLAEDVKILVFESVRELLFNAVKHSQARSANVSVRGVNQGVQVVVSDRGVGFDANRVTKAGEGGGFGLFSIRERLELIGGHFEIDSAPGNGSRFTLTAPMGKAAAMSTARLVTPETQDIGQGVQATARRGAAKIRVFLADDHAVMREGLKRLLGQEPDIEVIGEAADGYEAVKLAAQLLPDVILMDISMPKLSGIEATHTIHQDHPNISIIGLSLYDEAERVQALRKAGGVDYLTKSGPSSDVIAAIRACVKP